MQLICCTVPTCHSGTCLYWCCNVFLSRLCCLYFMSVVLLQSAYVLYVLRQHTTSQTVNQQQTICTLSLSYLLTKKNSLDSDTEGVGMVVWYCIRVRLGPPVPCLLAFSLVMLICIRVHLRYHLHDIFTVLLFRKWGSRRTLLPRVCTIISRAKLSSLLEGSRCCWVWSSVPLLEAPTTG